MPQPVIFGDPSSIFVRAILIALAEKGITAGLTGESDRPPGETAIERGGFVVRGTETILRYLDEALPGPRLQPEAPRQQARMNRALEIYFREAVPILGGRILMRSLGSAFTDEWISPDLPESLASTVRQTVGRLSEVLGVSPFFAGDKFTLADAAVAPLFDYLMPLLETEELIPPTSPVRSWWQHMVQRGSVWNTRPRSGFFAMLLPSV